jgi:hypothetical protein
MDHEAGHGPSTFDLTNELLIFTAGLFSIVLKQFAHLTGNPFLSVWTKPLIGST